MTQEQRDIKRKLAVLRYAEDCGNVASRRATSRQVVYESDRRAILVA